MQLRWSALIALWTILSGPVFSGHTPARPASAASSAVHGGKVSLQQLAIQQAEAAALTAGSPRRAVR